MAFVYRADRKINFNSRDQAQLGPGSYIGHSQYKPVPQVHQPFQSQTGREFTNKTIMPQSVYNPGPGSYQASLGFDQISKSMQSAKNLAMYGLEKYGIPINKPMNAFASKVERFNEKEVKEKSVTPGPGQYTSQQQWAKAKREGPKPEWQLVAWTKQPNAPSIPSHENVFGYEENDKGELIKSKNIDKVNGHTGVKSDTVGPGKYDTVKGMGATGKGFKWHVPEPKRRVPQNPDQSLKPPTISSLPPGPGHYNPDKVDVFPIYKYKPSSVFMSKVERNNQNRLKATSAQKPSRKPMAQSYNYSQTYYGQQDEDEYEEEEDDDGNTPGPGAYWNPTQSTAFRVKQVPERFQIFGSKEDRFVDHAKARQSLNNLGPGSYSQTTASTKFSKGKSFAPFSTTEQRFTEHISELPGPGQYVERNIADHLKRKTWGKQGVFGSTEKRFVQAQTLQTPGPGQYKPERSINVLDRKNDNNIKRSSSMFISSTKRNPYDEQKAKKEGVPVVQYDNQSGTIQDVVRKKVDAGTANPLLANLKAKRGINPAFSSNAPRFQERRVDEPEAFLGPGYYEQQSTFDPSKSANSQNKNMKFLTHAQRFGDMKKVEIPGPGHYSNEDLNSWFKRSYNMIFTE